MGIFGFKKKYDITPKQKDLNFAVAKHSQDVLKINAKLVVPTGYFVVIGKKGKVFDVFDEGEHYFNYANLPLLCRKYHIDEIKNGKRQDSISVDFYYVNKSIMQCQFATYRKVEMGTKAYGIFKTKVYGCFKYKVKEVSEFLQSLLNEFDYIKNGEAEEILERWVNEVVVAELEKQNFIIKDVIENNKIITDALKIKVSKLLSIAGLDLVDLKILKYKLPKKFQEASDINIAKQMASAQNDETESATENSLQQSQGEAKESQPQIENKGINNTAVANNISKEKIEKQSYYELDSIDNDVLEAKELLKEFGLEKEQVGDLQNLEINKTEEKPEDIEPTNNTKQNADEEISDITEETNVDNGEKEEQDLEHTNIEPRKEKTEYVPFGDFVISEESSEEIKQKAKKQASEKTFVDLSLNELYNKQNTKRCLNCGMESDINADHCVICGEKFNKGE